MKESDLFGPIKSYLFNEMLCDEVYAEVLDIDVVGKIGNVYIGIEMKTSLNFKVIEQADRRKHLVDYMFILVPKPKSYHSQIIFNWLKDLGIGLIYYDEKSRYESPIQRQFFGKRHKHRNYITEAIERDKELHLINIGGVKGGESITPYKNTIDKIKHLLHRNKDGLTIDEILSQVQTHYTAPKPSVAATLRKSWNEEWCECERVNGEQIYRMRETYRDIYWQEYSALAKEYRMLRRGHS